MTTWMRVAGLVLLPMLSACSQDPIIQEQPDPGEEVAIIRLEVAQQVIDVASSGATPTLSLPRGVAAISATFRRANGSTVALPEEDFSVNFVSGTTSRMTFTRTGPFEGNLTGLTTGEVTLSVTLVHGSHNDFGPRNVTVTVFNPTGN